MTLLELVQAILSSMDSDDVSSINETVEALQVANIVRDNFMLMVSNSLIPEHFTLSTLNSPASTSYPNYFSYPDGCKKLEYIKYKTQDGYVDLCYLSPEEFVNLSNKRDPDSLEVDEVVDYGGVTLNIRTDKQPTYWTTFDDNNIVCDSYDSTEDPDYLLASKTQAYYSAIPTFTISDSFTPDIDDNLFPLLLSESKSTAWFELKQQAHTKAEQSSKRQLSRIQKNRSRFDVDERVDFGRNRAIGRPFAKTAPDAGGTSGDHGELQGLSDDDHPHYYNLTRLNAWFTGKSTDDLPEGSTNFYNVQSDWNASSGLAEILNKPTLATVATTGDYTDLINTPTLATVATTGDYTDLINTPTIPTVSDSVYDATAWNGNTDAATKNAIRDKIETLADAAHTHTLSDITDAGTAAASDTGDFAAASHTHTSTDITNFGEAVDDQVNTLLVGGTDITLTYNDGANTLTIDSTAGGGGSTTFTGLTDTPSSFTGAASNFVKVNSTPNALEFVSGVSVSDIDDIDTFTTASNLQSSDRFIIWDNGSSQNNAVPWSTILSEIANDSTAFTVSNFDGAAIVTESEGIASNDNDTTLPTSAAVKDYVDSNAGGYTYETDYSMSGNSTVTYSGIPAGTTTIELSIPSWSSTAGGDIRMEIGDSGGLETTGYVGNATNNASYSTSYLMVTAVGASQLHNTFATLRKLEGTDTWLLSLATHLPGTGNWLSGGHKTLTGELTQLRIFQSTGSWDAGTLSVRYS